MTNKKYITRKHVETTVLLPTKVSYVERKIIIKKKASELRFDIPHPKFHNPFRYTLLIDLEEIILSITNRGVYRSSYALYEIIIDKNGKIIRETDNRKKTNRKPSKG